MRKPRKPAIQIRTERYNEQLHPPYIQIEVVLGGSLAHFAKYKYYALDNYGKQIARQHTLDDLDWAVNQFFKID